MRAIAALLLSLLAGPALGQTARTPPGSGAQHEGDFQLRVNGPLRVGSGDSATTLVVVNGDATVEGVVREGLVVINGTARISGHAEGSVVVVNGHLDLVSGARVDGDIVLHRSTLSRATDVEVAGVIRHRNGLSFGGAGMWLLWLSFTLVVLAGGVLYAALAPRALAESARYLAEHGGRSALAALIVVAVLPAIAVISFTTVIGIPLGLTIFFVVIPALSFLGYLVAGDVLGAAVLGRRWFEGGDASRYRTVIAGLLVFQLIATVPVLGGLAALVASQLGVGALVARRWSIRQPRAGSVVPAVAAS